MDWNFRIYIQKQNGEDLSQHPNDSGADMLIFVTLLLAATAEPAAAARPRRSPPVDGTPQVQPAPGWSEARSTCAAGCTSRGTCQEDVGRCDCPRGWTGDACTIPPEDAVAMCHQYGFTKDLNCSYHAAEPVPCLNACNGRGRCLAGWCHCAPGYFGADCSLSMPSMSLVKDSAFKQGGARVVPQLLAGQGYVPRARKPHVYVYELPPQYTTWWNVRRQDRPLPFLFWQRLLGSGARVEDGDSVDLYFVPVSMRNPSESRRAVGAIKFLAAHWPWWNKTEGRRHVFIHTGDTGRGEMLQDALALMRHAFLLTHWGLYKEYPSSGWRAAHRPGHDIVLPIHISPSFTSRGIIFAHSPLHPFAVSSPAPLRSKRVSAADAEVPMVAGTHDEAGGRNGTGRPPRDLQLLFAGRICGDHGVPRPATWPNCGARSRGYSQGVRQAVHYHHSNRTGYIITTRDPEYGAHLARARFCLAPTGGGHGHRQVLAVFSGCVPLCIGDYVLQPFEPELDWTRFSLTLPQSRIPTLHEVLEAVDDEALGRLQAHLHCAAQHLAWSTMTGAFVHETGRFDAFETTLEILRMRVEHPDEEPARYPELDEQYKDFMACRHSGDATVAAATSAAPGAAARGKNKVGQEGVDQQGGGPSTAADEGREDGVMEDEEGKDGRTETAGTAHRTGHAQGEAANARISGLCSLSVFEGNPPPCRACLDHNNYIIPGGAACCWASNLARCPRIWP